MLPIERPRNNGVKRDYFRGVNAFASLAVARRGRFSSSGRVNFGARLTGCRAYSLCCGSLLVVWGAADAFLSHPWVGPHSLAKRRYLLAPPAQSPGSSETSDQAFQGRLQLSDLSFEFVDTLVGNSDADPGIQARHILRDGILIQRSLDVCGLKNLIARR